MKPEVSIIIPCFKTEKTLEETLLSVYNQKFDNWEALIINDGSPDNLEEIALNWERKDSRFKYYKRTNGGLGSARNFGIMKSEGDFILPLDSDNRIRDSFIQNAVEIMEKESDIGVIYGDVVFFGERNEYIKVGEFNEYKMFYVNYIDACALIRKAVFDAIGLYETNLPYQGHEDWEFWLRVIQSNYKFYYMKEFAFDYRVTNFSMSAKFTEEIVNKNTAYIISKHNLFYKSVYNQLYNDYLKLKNTPRLNQVFAELLIDVKLKLFRALKR
ncbi:glycosyltransferase family 2 protein [Mangrovimonas sp. DI 80]|uniref:glycosyltransferase family 2 protein n=1 Tax=Mangrovimonas sp. DI 80 TaxID=1779330 RepID=UPI0015594572|nr:glycosyltransferase family 2 protein [Mangrovimonas sp. DI 80]